MKQLSIFVENKIGSLAEITTVLKNNSINIRAFSSFDSPDYGILRIVTNDSEQAKKVLVEEGFMVRTTEVIAVELKDQPGDLDRVLNILADENISVQYIYSFVLRSGMSPCMVMNLSNQEKAKDVLNKNNIQFE